jgi:hypothetical protein
LCSIKTAGLHCFLLDANIIEAILDVDAAPAEAAVELYSRAGYSVAMKVAMAIKPYCSHFKTSIAVVI